MHLGDGLQGGQRLAPGAHLAATLASVGEAAAVRSGEDVQAGRELVGARPALLASLAGVELAFGRDR